jgi:glycerol-3-phosphate acyltransferase PlsY
VILLLMVVSYFIGSIPVAWIVTKLVTGQDLRQMGSGNVGVMNVGISVARWAGVLVFLAEAAKAVLAIGLARSWVGGDAAMGLAVLSTFAGTRWPIWLRGAGGRGNTIAGTSLLIISWVGALYIGALWLVVRLVTHSSFVATRVSLLVAPIVIGLLTRSWWYVLMGAVFCLLFLTAHQRATDDHLIIKKRWRGLRNFLTMRPRKR